jgi:hypothetical protein
LVELFLCNDCNNSCRDVASTCQEELILPKRENSEHL